MVGCFEICAGVEGVEGRKFVASKMFTDMKRRYIFTLLVALRYNTEFDEANDITHLIFRCIFSHMFRAR